MKIGILGGLGREGRSVAKFAKNRYPKARIEILDQKISPDYLKDLESFDIVFRSPGVSFNKPEIRKAIEKGVRFSSATALFFEQAKGKIIGITGTKGKGTTSTLLYKILKNAGKDVYLAGNIGKSPLNILPKLKRSSISILELSSFQLQDLKRSPHIAGILGIFPDHMDAHKNFKEYFEAKANIGKYQNPEDKIFYIASDKWARLAAEKSKAGKNPLFADKFSLFGPEDLKIPGPHHYQNAIMAASIAESLGVSKAIILKTVRGYKGLEFRLQQVMDWKDVKVYNDSASTNPQTAAAAVRAFKERKILIVGGKDKNLDYSPFAETLKNSGTEFLILIGENKNKIRRAVSGSGVKIKTAATLKEAVDIAYQKAMALKKAGLCPVVVFSPAAASFDMFKDYKDRGKQFNKLVKNACL